MFWSKEVYNVFTALNIFAAKYWNCSGYVTDPFYFKDCTIRVDCD